MSKGNSDEDAIKFVLVLIAIAGVIVFFIIKWIIMFIVLLCSAIVYVVLMFKKSSEKRKVKETENNDYIIKQDKINTNQELTEYDNLFDLKIRTRGLSYYNNKTVKIKEDSNTNTKAIVTGGKDYFVNINYDEGKNITETTCTCPYCLDEGKKCKHIYATLLYKKYGEGELLENFNTKTENNVERTGNNTLQVLGTIMAIDAINEYGKKKKEEEQEEKQDKEYKEVYGLNDDEISHIKKEGYDVWNFEEEDKEEDDYYSEDDD